MKRDDMLTILFIIGLVFLFNGEPDLYDKLHAAAMRAADGMSCK